MKHAVPAYAMSLEATQYALEKMRGVTEKLVAANNALGREIKQAQIQLNMQGIAIERLRKRLYEKEEE